MDKQYIEEMLEKLSSGQESEWYVSKADFLPVRTILVARDDFKQFRGIAQRSGDVLYHFLQEPRS